jgi:hypothetical protein
MEYGASDARPRCVPCVRAWVAQPDFKIVEYGLWAASTILGLLTLMVMRRHVFKFPNSPFPAILGSIRHYLA